MYSQDLEKKLNKLQKMNVNKLHNLFVDISKGTPLELVAHSLQKQNEKLQKKDYLVFITNLITQEDRDNFFSSRGI